MNRTQSNGKRAVALDKSARAAAARLETYETAGAELLIGISLGVEHLLRYAEKAWPESGNGDRLADFIKAAREKFSDAS